MTNGKFAISVHILTLLASSQEEWTSSGYLAGSININPVLVRKELSNLRAHGIVDSKEGKAGGSRLAKSAEKILMSDVYEAVRGKDLLGKGVNFPNPACTIGRQINAHLDELYEEWEKALIASLAHTTLSDFCKRFD